MIDYTAHHKAVSNMLFQDNEINAYHISLYHALFSIWSNSNFQKEIPINAKELMKLSKIGSKSTYSKTLKELCNRKYIQYFPSFNPLISTKVIINRFDDYHKEDIKIIATEEAKTKPEIEITETTEVKVEKKQELQLILETEPIKTFSFDEFWKKYPNKTGKAKAKEKFEKLKEKEKILIEKHLPFFLANKPFENYNYPHATTYLNQKRYEDELIETKPNNNISNGQTNIYSKTAYLIDLNRVTETNISYNQRGLSEV